MKLGQSKGFKGVAGVAVALLFGAFLAVPARADNPSNSSSAEHAVPGTLNYVEGSVSIGSQAVTSQQVGSAQLEEGQSLTSQHGKAEILLTPGVFVRLGDDSTLQMISSSLTNTQVQLDRGHAIVEVDQIYPQNDLRVIADGQTIQLLKTGLYDFDLNGQPMLRVFDGKATVALSDNRQIEVKGDHELSLAAPAGSAKIKTQKFDKKDYAQDDLYRWSSLRSAYVAEANVNAAAIYANSGWGPWGPGWWGAGWYWDPWFYGYTFIPGDGIFYSPFGWGFYSPWFVWGAPYYRAWGRPGIYRSFSANYRNWGPGEHYVGSPHYAQGVYRGAGSAGAFHSGPRAGGSFGGGARGGEMRGGFAGGGFHGGGGGSPRGR
jgi:hypothetical protein